MFGIDTSSQIQHHKSEHEVIAEYNLEFLSGDNLDYIHAKAELTKAYD